MKSKLIRVLTFCLVALFVAGVATSTVLSVRSLEMVTSLKNTVSSYMNLTEDTSQENDVIIASEYTINPTTDISDAYLSGDSSKLSDRDKETLRMASDVLKEIITDGMTDYEKELAVYQWMTAKLQNDTGLLTVVPSTQEDCDNPYGVLKYHNAVCVGYATTFRLFMQMMGIECMVVHNSELTHSWDLVNLDGEWYHTDIYMDAGIGNYMDFNMNDELCSSAGHDWNVDFFPAANGVKYNYACQNSIQVDDVYGIAAVLKSAIDDRKGNIGIDFGSNVTDQTFEIIESMLSEITNRLSESSEYMNLYLNWNWLTLDADNNILVVSIAGYKTQSDYNLSDEESQKVNSAINAAFGAGDGSDDSAEKGED